MAWACLAGGGAGLSALEGPASGGCGCELRGTGDRGEDARRGQAFARGGSDGAPEAPCCPGRKGAARRVDGGGGEERVRKGDEEDGGVSGPCRAFGEARGVRGADGVHGVT
jgi:hypothetical protein